MEEGPPLEGVHVGRLNVPQVLSLLFPNVGTPPVEWSLQCCVAITRDGRTLAMARNARLIICDVRESSLIRVQRGRPTGGFVSQIAWFHVASDDPTSRAAPIDFLLVGWSTGHLSIFSDRGTLLASQLLHRGPVLQLKPRAAAPSERGVEDRTEDLVVLYSGVLVRVDGLHLVTLLRARARCLGLGKDVDRLPSVQLPHRRWRLMGQSQSLDAACCGLVGPSFFESQATEHASLRFIVVGKQPAVALFLAKDVENAFLSAAALATTVATKITNHLATTATSLVKRFLWKDHSPRSSTRERPHGEGEEPAENERFLPVQIGLNDSQRVMTSVTLDPTGRLAVITDTLGRVCLMDVNDFLLVRMWKGYRDAQCAWIHSRERRDGEGMNAPPHLHLVVFAPRRNLMEVWRVRYGERDAAVPVPQGCRLLGTSHPVGAPSLAQFPARCYLLYSSGHVDELRFHRGAPGPQRWGRHVHGSLRFARHINHLLLALIPYYSSGMDESLVVQFLCASEQAQQQQDWQGAESTLLNVLGRMSSPSAIVRALASFGDEVPVNLHIRATERGKEVLLRIIQETPAHQQDKNRTLSSGHKVRRVSSVPGTPVAALEHITLREALLRAYALLQSTESESETSGVRTLQQTPFADSLHHRYPPTGMSAGPAMPWSAFADCFCSVAEGGIAILESLAHNQMHWLLQFLLHPLLAGRADVVEACLVHLQIQVSTFQESFLHWFTATPLDVLLQTPHPQQGENSLQLFVHRLLNTEAEETSDTPLHVLYDACYSSTQIGHALLLARLILGVVEGTRETATSRWESMVKRLEQVNFLSQQLGEVDEARRSLCVKAMEETLCLSRLVALQELLITHTAEGARGLECDPVPKGADESENARRSVVTTLLQQYPLHTSPGLLAAHRAVELFTRWSVHPNEIGVLVDAGDNTDLIPSSSLKGGIAIHAWSIFCKPKVSSLAQMLEQAGRIPKERFFVKCVEMGVTEVLTFLDECLRILFLVEQTIVLLEPETDQEGENGNVWPPVEDSLLGTIRDNFIQNLPPLTWLLEHLLFLQVLQLGIKYQMKTFRPLSLFPPDTCLLSSLSVARLSEKERYPTVAEARLEFVLQVLRGDTNDGYSIARDLGLDAEVVRYAYVQTLYESGDDIAAEEVATFIQDRVVLGQLMLSIGRARVAVVLRHLKEERGTAAQLAQLPPDTCRWILQANTTGFDFKRERASLNATKKLLLRAVMMLPAGSAENIRAASVAAVVTDLMTKCNLG